MPITKERAWTVQKSESGKESIRAKTRIKAIIIGNVIRQRSGSDFIVKEANKEDSR